jgi:hypothetical protein
MAEPKYDRGSALSIFKSDRAEDFVALVLSLVIVAIVIMFVPR